MVTGHAWIALAQCVDGWLVYNVYCTHCGWFTIYIPMYVVHQHCRLRLNIQPLPTITAHSVHYASFTTWTKLCFPCDDDNILATMFNNADTANMNTNTVWLVYKQLNLQIKQTTYLLVTFILFTSKHLKGRLRE